MEVFFRDFFLRLSDKTFQENPYDELAISAVSCTQAAQVLKSYLA